jgi:hypothetical protein
MPEGLLRSGQCPLCRLLGLRVPANHDHPIWRGLAPSAPRSMPSWTRVQYWWWRTTPPPAFTATFLKLHFYLDDWLLRCQCRATLRRVLQRVRQVGWMGTKTSPSWIRLRISSSSESDFAQRRDSCPIFRTRSSRSGIWFDSAAAARVSQPGSFFSSWGCSTRRQIKCLRAAYSCTPSAPDPLPVAPPVGPWPGGLLGAGLEFLGLGALAPSRGLIGPSSPGNFDVHGCLPLWVGCPCGHGGSVCEGHVDRRSLTSPSTYWR